MAIGTFFTLFVVPALYVLLAAEHRQADDLADSNDARKKQRARENHELA